MEKAAAEDPRLWGLLAGNVWRRARRRLRVGPVFRWRFIGPTPERLLIAPPDLRPADPQIARDFYAGRFPLAGRVVETASSPFAPGLGDPQWRAAMHGFHWLRHMRAEGTQLASANARALVGDWLDHWSTRYRSEAFAPALVARRLIAWLQHSNVVLAGAELPFYRAYLRALAAQVRFLRVMAPEMADGEERLRARIALAFAALSMPVKTGTLMRAARDLSRELERQILADGGHVSRNPQAIVDLLSELVPLRQTWRARDQTPPATLIGAIDRMYPALRFFRHQDGEIARFNGAGPTRTELIAALMRHDDAEGAPVRAAAHSGYQRLSAGDSTVIVDAGSPPPLALSGQAHAGTLSFELSSGRACFIVNAGVDPDGAPEWRRLARATAAHSTAVINDASSARLLRSDDASALIGAPLAAGPTRVSVRRLDEAVAQTVTASHDGYLRRFAIVHERTLSLSADGDVLFGRDAFADSRGGPPGAAAIAIRFHVHPAIALYRDETNRIVLMGSGTDQWSFEADGLEPLIEESVFFADFAGPRRSAQLTLSFTTAERPFAEWRMQRLRRAGMPHRP